jgi:hypothetical protein
VAHPAHRPQPHLGEMFPRASIAGLKLTASLWETGGKSKIDV